MGESSVFSSDRVGGGRALRGDRERDALPLSADAGVAVTEVELQVE
jgi:hypothetical protein